MLTPGAKAEVKKILGPAGGSVSLASISTWADDIRMLRPETRPWHYVTLQIGEPRYDSTHADSANVVKALKRQLAILAKPDADRYAREEALKWVVHLVGDLHQPLHTGEDHDKGGNLQKVKVNRRTYNLHAVWDYVLLERLHLSLDSLHGMLEREIAADPAFIQRNASGTVEAWTDETHAKAAKCYLLRGKPLRKGIKIQLDKDYVDAATLTVFEQLKIAGVRLAFALNRALDPGSKTAVAPLARPAPGWRDDKGAFFRQADEIRETAGGAEEADTVSAAKPPAAAAQAAKHAKPARSHGARIPEGRYSWSVNSDVYHFSECAEVARIKKKNLRTGDVPPLGMRLHAGCPVPR
ncbi:MAG: nuclease [Fibrobacteres bacterium]|nr:nuclease [Fibrobacterota bacterium]